MFDLHGTGMIPAAGVGGVGRDMGVGTAKEAVPKLMIATQQAFAAAGAATLNVQFQLAPDNNGVAGAFTTAAETGVIGKAALINNIRIWDIDWPRALTPALPLAPGSLPRFAQLNYVVATGPFTAGKVQSEIVLGRDDHLSYQSGFTVAN
jgi:hypothetical protein